MKPSIHTKLESISDRLEEISALLADPDVMNDQNQFRELSKEYAQIDPVVQCFKHYKQNQEDLSEAEALLKDNDPDMREMGAEESKKAKAIQETLELELQKLLE